MQFIYLFVTIIETNEDFKKVNRKHVRHVAIFYTYHSYEHSANIYTKYL